MTRWQNANTGDGGIANAGHMDIGTLNNIRTLNNTGTLNLGGRDEPLNAKVDFLIELSQERSGAAAPPAMLQSLAQSLAREGTNADTALREIDRSVEIASRQARAGRRLRGLGRLADDLGRLNAEGRFQEAADLVETAVRRAHAEDTALSGAEHDALLETAIDQSYLARDGRGAAGYIAARLARVSGDEDELVTKGLERVEELFAETQRCGLPFDADVAFHLAGHICDWSKTPRSRARAGLMRARARALHGAASGDTASLDTAIAELIDAASACMAEGQQEGLVGANTAIATAKARLAELRPDEEALDWALKLFEAVLQAPELLRDTQAWGRAQISYACALRLVVRRTPQLGAAVLPKARKAAEEALSVFRRGESLDWAQAQLALANVLSDQALIAPSPTSLAEAEAAYGAAFEYLSPSTAPFGWAIANCALANLYFAAAGYWGNPAVLQMAARHCAEGKRVLARVGSPVHLRQAEQLSAAIEMARSA